jgi:hypothetical protein
MEEFILSPFLSTLISIFLFLGCYELGKIITKQFSLIEIVSSVSKIEFQYTTIGIIFLLAILFPLVSFTNHAKMILQIFAVILLLLSLNFFKDKKNLISNFFIPKKDLYLILFILFIIQYFLLALSPLTSADVLDYHTGVALNILRFNTYLIFPEWFTGLQSGGGEILIALGFSIGSEQFGSLVQFSSVLTISGIIIFFTKKYKSFISEYFLILIILSCPILIFLLSGNKPQIFYSSLILFAFSLNFTNLKNNKESYKIYLLINILICLSVIGKFSFNLTGLMVWIYSTYQFVNKKNFYKIILAPLIVFLFLFCPFILWKFNNLGGSIINYFVSPFPLHLPGYENFLSHNRGSQEIPFPNFLLYTSISRFTEFLAANTLIFLILLFNLKQNKKILVIISLSALFVLISNLYASPSARYYLDIILWMTLGLTFIKKMKYKKLFQLIFFPQIFIIFLILTYANTQFLPGAFNQKQYVKIKQESAYLYSGFDWVNKNIPDESRVIIVNRGLAQYKDKVISGGFSYFTNEKQSIYYKNLIKQKKPEYLVYFGNKPEIEYFKGCVTKLYKEKNNVGFHATRNPFNKGGNYNAYIFKIDYLKLPNCN